MSSLQKAPERAAIEEKKAKAAAAQEVWEKAKEACEKAKEAWEKAKEAWGEEARVAWAKAVKETNETNEVVREAKKKAEDAWEKAWEARRDWAAWAVWEKTLKKAKEALDKDMEGWAKVELDKAEDV